MQSKWASRIVGYGDENPEQLLANPENFRRHPDRQKEWLRAGLSEIGWVAPIIVNRTTGHVVDGHLRVEEAMRQGQATVPVSYVELSPDEERRILAIFDRITGMAFEDNGQLAQLLGNLSLEGDSPLDSMLAEIQSEVGTPPLVDNSGDNDTRSDRQAVSHTTSIVQIGRFGAPVEIDLVDEFAAAIKEQFGEEAEQAIGEFVRWAIEALRSR